MRAWSDAVKTNNQRRYQMAKTERRHFPRHHEKATIQILAISEESKDGEKGYDLIPARLYNQSDEGLYFEIDRDLEPGSNVSIRGL